MKKIIPTWRGLTVQLLAITVLPLTLLLLLIAFGSVSLHQQDMRELVGERDERAVKAASAGLASELHHRAASIASLAALSAASDGASFPASADLASDFDGGLAHLELGGKLIQSSGASTLWDQVSRSGVPLASASDPGPLFSPPFLEPTSNEYFVIVSQFVSSRNILIAGAFSPEALARETLSASYPDTTHVSVFLLASANQVLFSSGPLSAKAPPLDHPGVTEALRGETGMTYLKQDSVEHVVTYAPIRPTGWALLTEEDWEMVSGPSLQLTQMAPLVIVPAFLLAVLALWFVASRIVQPLQKLESKASALAWGDFEAIQEPVGGITEVRQLQLELTEMARKVKSAQEGLHDYIGAITSAQEEERNRLARELHDDTIQAVIALRQRVQLAQKSVHDEAGRRSLIELESLAGQTIENLRRLTRALRPIYLEDLGLVTALEMLANETTQQNPLHVDFQKKGEERRLPREVELSLYRIAQEALTNVVRHSEATAAELMIDYREAEVDMEVSDNGRGFNVPKSPTEFAPNGHFGLLGVYERADLIGARLEVDSAPGRGTRLRVRL